jgi:superfamily II DNA/RNA helicase
MNCPHTGQNILNFRSVISYLIPENHTYKIALFATTVPSEVLEMSKKFMQRDPIQISINVKEFMHKSFRQFYLDIDKEVAPNSINLSI